MRIRVAILVLLVAVGSGQVIADGHRNQFQCFHIFYVSWDYEFIGYDYQCFDTVEVVGSTVYVDPGGYWGPPSWPENPPPFPPEEPPGGGGGVPTPSVSVTAADITQDVVRVQLTGAEGGTLAVSAVKDDGSRVTLAEGWRNSGESQFSFQADGLGPGVYVRVDAEWYVGEGQMASGSRSVDFNVRGRWRQSEYATIYEYTCPESPKSTGYILQAVRGCDFGDPIEFYNGFVRATWLNGSGVSRGFGPLQLPWGSCMRYSGEDKFKSVSVITGSCGAVGDSTVAQGVPDKNHLPTHCGKSVFIVGVGVKTVADSCPDCWHGGVEGQLDNYTPEVLENCARGARDKPGTYNTIFLAK